MKWLKENPFNPKFRVLQNRLRIFYAARKEGEWKRSLGKCSLCRHLNFPWRMRLERIPSNASSNKTITTFFSLPLSTLLEGSLKKALNLLTLQMT